jgi:hypothetical protein
MALTYYPLQLPYKTWLALCKPMTMMARLPQKQWINIWQMYTNCPKCESQDWPDVGFL